jgi:hypothetical protein
MQILIGTVSLLVDAAGISQRGGWKAIRNEFELLSPLPLNLWVRGGKN